MMAAGRKMCDNGMLCYDMIHYNKGEGGEQGHKVKSSQVRSSVIDGHDRLGLLLFGENDIKIVSMVY